MALYSMWLLRLPLKKQKRNWAVPLLESIKPIHWKRTLENPAPGHLRAFHISDIHNLYLFEKLCCSAVFSNSNIMVLQLEFNGTLLHFRATTAQVYQFWDESMVKEQYWGHIFPLSAHQWDRGIEHFSRNVKDYFSVIWFYSRQISIFLIWSFSIRHCFILWQDLSQWYQKSYQQDNKWHDHLPHLPFFSI